MFERRHERILPRPKFVRRMARSAAAGLGLVALSLGLGMSGYHFIAHLSWIDAFLNAAMILAGMGPVAALTTSPAKLFAGVYAMYCGLTLLTVAGVIFAPLLHRLLHTFHLEESAPD